MTPLRQRMLEDMRVRNLAQNTQRSYLQQVSSFARHFQRSPEILGPEEVPAYLVHLTTQRKLARQACASSPARCASSTTSRSGAPGPTRTSPAEETAQAAGGVKPGGALQAVGSFKLNVPIRAHDLDHTWRVDFRPFAGIHHRKRAAHEVMRLREAFKIDDPPVGLGGFDAKDIPPACVVRARRRLLWLLGHRRSVRLPRSPARRGQPSLRVPAHPSR